MRSSRAIRATAWSLVAAGVAGPLVRRRLRLPPAAVLGAGAVAPAALSVALRPGLTRKVGVCALNMWAYLAAYEMPHDDPARLERRVRVDYPIAVDRLLGLGVTPTVRLQHGLSDPERFNALERVLVWCHWMWFAVPHLTLVYVLARDPERFPSAAARMYAVFDVGAVFYWAIPTAPPWYAARHGRLETPGGLPVRRMMIEYGEQFWGDRWPGLYDVLGGNPLAAMPSLHFATSMMGARLLWEVGPAPGVVGWTYAGLLGVALVYLGEHYAVDILAGAALAESVCRLAPRAAPLARRIARALGALEARTAAGGAW